MAFPLLPLIAAIGAGSSLASAMTPGEAQVVKPSGPAPAPIPSSPLGNVQDSWTPIDYARSAAMASKLPESTPVPMNLLAAVRTDANGQQPILQALQAAAQGGGAVAQALPQKAPKASAPTRGPSKAAAAQVQQQAAPQAPQAAPMGPAPAPSNTPSPAANAAAGAKTFLGLSGDQWGALGQATGILANLMRPGPAAHVLTPGGGGPGNIPLTSVGGGLYEPGSQRLGTTSQFAIQSPSVGGAYGAHTNDLLQSLRG